MDGEQGNGAAANAGRIGIQGLTHIGAGPEIWTERIAQQGEAGTSHRPSCHGGVVHRF